MWWSPPTWMVVLLMGAAQFGTEKLDNRNYFFAQAFVTPMALLGSACRGTA